MAFIEKKNLKEKTVVQKIIDEIKNSLIKEELLPGDKLPSEEQLCKNFFVSRISVREAIKMLSALGVVTIKRGNGTYISKGVNLSAFNSLIFQLILQEKSSKELAELRTMLEIGILEVVMDKRTQEDIIEIEESIKNFEKEYSRETLDRERLSQCDLDFHLKVTEATHNVLIIGIAEAIFQLYVASFSKILYKKSSVKESIRVHKMIFEGIKSRDIKKTRNLIYKSSKRWQELLLKSEKE
jgi:DNA-binding FadR family transcriptional regulator